MKGQKSGGNLGGEHERNVLKTSERNAIFNQNILQNHLNSVQNQPNLMLNQDGVVQNMTLQNLNDRNPIQISDLQTGILSQNNLIQTGHLIQNVSQNNGSQSSQFQQQLTQGNLNNVVGTGLVDVSDVNLEIQAQQNQLLRNQLQQLKTHQVATSPIQSQNNLQGLPRNYAISSSQEPVTSVLYSGSQAANNTLISTQSLILNNLISIQRDEARQQEQHQQNQQQKRHVQQRQQQVQQRQHSSSQNLSLNVGQNLSVEYQGHQNVLQQQILDQHQAQQQVQQQVHHQVQQQVLQQQQQSSVDNNQPQAQVQSHPSQFLQNNYPHNNTR